VVTITIRHAGGTSSTCSAWILNEHWILTAAHCLTGAVNGEVIRVSRADRIAGLQPIYEAPARYFRHPLFNDSTAHDVGVIHLDNAGLRIDLTGIARMYSDTRRPWADASLPRGISAAGWGFSTPDPNDPTGCTGGGGALRTTNTMTVDVSSATTSVVTSPIGAQFPCSGDSGAPWLLRRGDATAGFELMGFAVHSRRRGSPRKGEAAPLDDNRSFIEDTVSSLNSTDVYGTSCHEHSLGGFRFRDCEQTGRGWGQLKALGYCMLATGATPGSPVTLTTCNQTVNAQVWGLLPSGEIKSLLGTNLCLEAPSAINGTALRVATCNNGSTQRFGNGAQGQLTLGFAFSQCIAAVPDLVIATPNARIAPQAATTLLGSSNAAGITTTSTSPLLATTIAGLGCTNLYCVPKVQVQACAGGTGRSWNWGTF
jgi:hypothetical protein